MSFNTFFDTTLIFFNFIALNVGTYLILNNYEDLNTKKGIQDCYNVFLLSGISVINNLIPLIGCAQFDSIIIISFFGSLGLGGYNTYNLYMVDYNCSNYYEKEYTTLWFYYCAATGLQLFNVFLYFFKCYCPKEKKFIDRQRQVLINNNVGLNEATYPPANIYEDTETEDFYDGLQDDSLIPAENIR